ncbi:hypothetical protein KIPB_003611, partial [Kipferlia bialata]
TPYAWHSFNDTKVKKVTEAQVLSCQPYLLFYQRRPTTLQRAVRKRVLGHISSESRKRGRDRSADGMETKRQGRPKNAKGVKREGERERGLVSLREERERVVKIEGDIQMDRERERERERESESDTPKARDARSCDSCVVSADTLYRALMFSGPGSIDNSSLLCPTHTCPSASMVTVGQEYTVQGAVLPACVQVPSHAYDEIEALLGGGPRIHTSSLTCGDCPGHALDVRRVMERDTVSQLEGIDKGNPSSDNEQHRGYYMCSKDWVSKWRAFVLGGPVPPPLTNHEMLNGRGELKRRLRPGVDYVSLSPSVHEEHRAGVTIGSGPISEGNGSLSSIATQTEPVINDLESSDEDLILV